MCEKNGGPGRKRLQITAVTQTPYIIEEEDVLKSETQLTVKNTGEPFGAWVELEVPGVRPYRQFVGQIPSGEKTVTVNVPELREDGDSVAFRIYEQENGTPLAEVVLPQKKVRHWTVYVSHSSHVDFGYTDYQEYLRTVKWPSHLDEAFRFIEETDSWKEEEKFRHHIESSYLLYGSALQVRNADWVQKLKAYLRQGRLAYSASCMNTSMEVMSTEQLVRYYYYSARLLMDMLGEESSGVAMMVDNPSISWSNIDVMAGAGIKYMYLGPNFNWRTPRTLTEGYPRLFYMRGRNSKNKVLILSGTLYNLDEMQFVYDGPNATPVPLEVTVRCTGDALMNKYHTEQYPFDAVLEMVDQYWDNGPLFHQVMERVQEMNSRTNPQGRPYLYPRFINSNIKDFCAYVEEKYASSIASYSGTIENWWCYGTPSDAYCAAKIRETHDLLPAAETFHTLAARALRNKQYPCKRIADAYHYMMLYDEHTFGPSNPVVGDQHIWKRNTAIAAKRIAEDLLKDAVSAVSTLIPAKRQTVMVHNPLSWTRGGIVKVSLSELPEHFDLLDLETGKPVKYQRLEDCAEFYAEGIPGIGYKCYEVRERKEDPLFSSEWIYSENTIENRFYRISLDEQGEIVSILDKQNGGAELVDSTAPYRMNEFVYMTSRYNEAELLSVSRMSGSSVHMETGAVEGRITLTGFCDGTAGIQRTVILYDAVPRIDFVNTVKKHDALGCRKQDEEGYFVFPLNVPDFTLRHEMPVGDVRPYVDPEHARPGERPEIEQFYTSSTDFYTVNRWIDASCRERGITLSTLSAPIVQYGERRTFLYDLAYRTEKPWIYSYAFNNKWGTNFMETQPGVLTYQYSLASHKGGDWRQGRADQFGWETSVPLVASVIAEDQIGAGYRADLGQWISMDVDHVVITTAKIAEANGEGTILRFNETLGRETKVTLDLSFFQPESVMETDLMENDRQPLPLEGGRVTFMIDGYGWKTLRLRFGETAAEVNGVSAGTDSLGTLVSWNEADGAAFYEVFRGTAPEFRVGTGSYLGSTCGTEFLDRQVPAGLDGAYFYRVRAAGAGRKGNPSQAVKAAVRVNPYPGAAVPSELKADVAFGNRVSLSWLYPADCFTCKGFKVFRDDQEIADLSPMHNSYLDIQVIPGGSYRYSVAAYDESGALSERSNSISVKTARGEVKPGNIAPEADILASSQLDAQHPATAAADGLIGITGAWASAGERNPWIRFSWPEKHRVYKAVVYGRDTNEGHVRKGVLEFSDGSMIEAADIPGNGSGKCVEFSPREIEWVIFRVTDGKGINVGIAELELFEEK